MRQPMSTILVSLSILLGSCDSRDMTACVSHTPGTGGGSIKIGCSNATGIVYSTDLRSNENPLSEGGRWVTGKTAGFEWNNPKIESGVVFASVLSGVGGSSRYSDSIAHLSKSFAAFNADQNAQATVHRVQGYSASHEIELLLRFSIEPHDAHGYEVLWGVTGYVAVVRWNGSVGEYTALYDPGRGSIAVPHEGDVLRAEIAGSVITVKRNGALVAQVDAAAAGGRVWNSGQPGIGFWAVQDAVLENYGWKSIAAGNL
jgi:hypothetical protein